MLTWMVTRYSGWAVVLGLGWLALGCVETPGAEHIVGPDGTRMLHVHCGDEQVACFQLAGESCPNGYDLSPIFDPHDGNFLVRCRTPKLVTSVVATTQSPSREVQASAAKDGWPPSEVATPMEPWPAPSTNPNAPPTPRTATGAVDIGY